MLWKSTQAQTHKFPILDATLVKQLHEIGLYKLSKLSLTRFKNNFNKAIVATQYLGPLAGLQLLEERRLLTVRTKPFPKIQKGLNL